MTDNLEDITLVILKHELITHKYTDNNNNYNNNISMYISVPSQGCNFKSKRNINNYYYYYYHFNINY